MSVIVKFLGTAQDGGIPQIGCKCEMCTDIRIGKRKEVLQAAIGIENTETGNRYMIEATPAFSKQYQSFIADKNGNLDGIFLTHAHMGHYTGLMYLGKEALNSKETKVYVSKKMAEFLKNNAPWSQLVKLKNIELIEFESGKELSLDNDIKIIPVEVPHRNEFADTHGFIIKGNKSFFFVPDIFKQCDYLAVDATFYTKEEIGNIRGRNFKEIPHPTVEETINFIEKNKWNLKDKKIILTHFNHTNLLFTNK
ncbi:MBL fold metallo-hydrolase, partial [Fusobacterium varium]